LIIFARLFLTKLQKQKSKMKKVFLAFVAAATIALVSCNNNKPAEEATTTEATTTEATTTETPAAEAEPADTTAATK
jgi:hypothetical protein